MIPCDRFKTRILLTLISHLSINFNLQTYACLFKLEYNVKREAPQPWDTHTSQRNVDKTCECGHDHFSEPEPQYNAWSIYIYVFDDSNPRNLVRPCMGTVINKKMVLTSHNCLKIIDAHIGAYEYWNPRPKLFESVFARKENVILSKSKNAFDSSHYYSKVTDIIYNEQWIRNAIKKPQPDDDIAILIMEDEWVGTNVVPGTAPPKPICLPIWTTPYDPTGFKGYYYGAGGKLEEDPNIELRRIGDAFVLPGEICDKDTKMIGFSTNETLCIEARLVSPTTPGGPLILSADGQVDEKGFTEDRTVFLMGLASVMKPLGDNDLVTITYFSNIRPWIPYIEYHAEQVGARWCTTPSLDLKEKFRDTDFQNGRKRKFVWEVGPPFKRDESLDCVCGLHNLEKSEQEARIVGGVVATPYEFPWIIAFEGTFKNAAGESTAESGGNCGGSIINNMLILTAAHCVFRANRYTTHESNEWTADIMYIIMNLHINDLEVDPHYEEVVAKKVFYYRAYAKGINTYFYDYDLALVVLEKPLEFSNAKKHGEAMPGDIRPICLPREGKPIVVVGKNATVAGWGKTGTSDNPDHWAAAYELLKLQIPIVPLEECSKRAPAQIRDTMLCAGYFTRYKDSSQGDSGGPLIIRENGWWTQVGVVSFGQDVDDYEDYYNHTVALYVNVQKFLRFIDYHSNKVGAKWCKSHV